MGRIRWPWYGGWRFAARLTAWTLIAGGLLGYAAGALLRAVVQGD